MKHHRHKPNSAHKKNLRPEHHKGLATTSKHTVTAYTLSTDAKGIARLEDGSIVFVDGLLPTETALIEVHTKKASYKRARIIERQQSAPDRATPPCVYYEQCGGCQLQHIEPQQQTSYKIKWLFETLTRIGKWDEKQVTLVRKNLQIVYLNSKYYRRRVRLHFNGRSLGFRQRDTHQLVDIDHCLIAKPQLNEKIRDLRKILPALYKELQGLFLCKSLEFDLELTLTDDDRITIGVINLTGDTLLSKNSLEKITAALHKRLEIEANHLIHIKHPALGRFKLKKESFVQPHFQAIFSYYTHMQQSVAEFLKSALDKKNFPRSLKNDTVIAWDLYAGSGVFSCIPHFEAKRIGLTAHTTAVEGVKEAIDSLNLNYKNTPITALTLDVHDFGNTQFALSRATPPTNEKPHVVILDPPRTGAGIPFMQQLVELCAPQACVLYLACDPASFARDTAILLEGGFQIRKTVLFDSFGQTHHYEVLGYFVKGC